MPQNSAVFMDLKPQNIFENIPKALPDEQIEQISGNGNVKIERIISRGHSTPEGYWYDQDQNEYVILLKGEAKIDIKNQEETITLKPGDYLDIPAHVKHRVTLTSPREDTIWLTVFY